MLFPAALLWILTFANRETEDFDYRYGFLLAGYRKGVRWWELTVLARRLAIVCTLVFLNEYQQVQIATAFLILLIALFAHMLYKPYTMNEGEGVDEETRERGLLAGWLERWALSVLLLTFTSAFYFLGELKSKKFETARFFIGLFVVVINIVFLCLFFYEWSKAQSDAHREVIEQTSKKLGKVLANATRSFTNFNLLSSRPSPPVGCCRGGVDELACQDLITQLADTSHYRRQQQQPSEAGGGGRGSAGSVELSTMSRRMTGIARPRVSGRQSTSTENGMRPALRASTFYSDDGRPYHVDESNGQTSESGSDVLLKCVA